ncbi:MAG: hemin uptake protein HemP [Rhodospirillaceae bacterium]|nr:hemin uptake protein HemP [Rhodospirillaceae bacterium]
MDRQTMDFRGVLAPTDAPLERRSESTVRQGLPDRPILRHRGAEGQGGPANSNRHVHLGQAGRSVETVSLQSILKGAREAIIDFDGAAYRLRITRNHRLILTK